MGKKKSKGICWTGAPQEHSLAARGVKSKGLAKDFKKESTMFGKNQGKGFKKAMSSNLGGFEDASEDFAKKRGFKSAKPKKKKKAKTKSGVMPLSKQKGSLIE